MLADLAGLVGVLNDHDARFVVIGSVAVAAHGYVRASEDLDIVPDPDRDNLDRLGNALVSLDARLAADPHRELGPAERRPRCTAGATSRSRLGWATSTSSSACPACPASRPSRGTPSASRLGDVHVAICSRAHLLAMKAAHRPAVTVIGDATHDAHALVHRGQVGRIAHPLPPA